MVSCLGGPPRELLLGFGHVAWGGGPGREVERFLWSCAVWEADVEEGLLMFRDREAGGPTGTMREPNSTPIVTS